MGIVNKADSFLKKISPVQKASFFGAVIWGLITHLAVFSAGLMYHDGVHYSGLGATYSSGRWMLGLMEDVFSRISGVYQLPYINGFITIFLIAVAAMLITCMLRVKSRFSAVLIGAILVSFPSVASLFAFMFTAPAYTVAFLMAVFAVFLVSEKPSLPRVAVGALLICMSLGIYQAYLNFAAALAYIIVLSNGLGERERESI